MDHATSQCPSPKKPGKGGFKGGKSKKGKNRTGGRAGSQPKRFAMYVLGSVLGLTTYLNVNADAISLSSNLLPPIVNEPLDIYTMESEIELIPQVEEINFTQNQTPYTLMDTGASTGVAGIEWLKRVEGARSL